LRVEFFDEVGDEIVKDGFVFGGEDVMMAVEAVFEGVEAGFEFAFAGFGAGAPLGVAAVGLDLFFSWAWGCGPF